MTNLTSTAQDDMNDKLRNHGLPTPKEGDTAEPMSAEMRAWKFSFDMGLGFDDWQQQCLAEQIRQAEQAARAETQLECAKECVRLREKARAHERRKALGEAEQWCHEKSIGIGAVDGYDYRSGEEYAYRSAALHFQKLANSSEPGEDT